MPPLSIFYPKLQQMRQTYQLALFSSKFINNNHNSHLKSYFHNYIRIYKNHIISIRTRNHFQCQFNSLNIHLRHKCHNDATNKQNKIKIHLAFTMTWLTATSPHTHTPTVSHTHQNYEILVYSQSLTHSYQFYNTKV